MKPRIFSAHPSVNHHSQKARRLKTASEFSQANIRDTSKGSKGRQRSSFLRKTKPWQKGYGKQPEELMEENLNLKSFINNLQEQLTLQRSKIELNKRKNEKVTRQLNRQFQKEIYYSGKNPNSYLVSGVKSQYQNIKNLYEQKCNDFQSVLRTIENTNYEEMRTYIEILQKQNATLSSQLDAFNSLRNSYAEPYSQSFQSTNQKKMFSNHRRNSGSKIYTQMEEPSQKSNKNVDVLVYQLAEQKNNLNRAKSIIEKYSEKLEIVSKERDQHSKKVQFLQKLLIQKDNNEHDARRDFKRIERQKNHFEAECSRLEEVLSSKEKELKEKLQKAQQKQTKKFQIERQIFNKSLQQKNQYIAKLEKEIRSLSAMLCYWKPLDEPEDDLSRQLNRQDSPKSRQMKDLVGDKHSLNRARMLSEHRGKDSAFSDHSYLENIGRVETQIDRSMIMQDGGFKRTMTGNKSNSLEGLTILKEKPRRQCSKKYSEDAKKARKVNINEIKGYGQLIRYRLIGHNFSFQQVRKLFDDRMPKDGAEDEYIQMKTIKDVLMKHPFSLDSDEATLVSRYVVQDSSNQYVYWDQLNQISINIAKSIIKAFIGHYHLPDQQKIRAEWNKIKNVYMTNMMTALRMLAPKGVITLQKFIELLVGLGIEMDDQLEDWVVGQMVVASKSLEELSYEILQKL